MSLSSLQLDAFFEISRLKSFSKAALTLHVTQSALSQRISQLESELGTSLFIREPSGLRLTSVGEELLRYCKIRANLEGECVSKIKDVHSGAMVGVLRIGAYSTMMRSIVLPSLSEFLIAHPTVRFEIASKEMRELSGALRSGELDFIYLDHAFKNENVESVLLGYEEYILIESKHSKANNSIYLDHDPADQTTFRFFEQQRKKPECITRSFLDEIYGIIDGVALGLGRAVVPLHIARCDKRVKRVTKFESLLIPVYLCYFRLSVYTSLQKATLALLENTSRRHLLQPDVKQKLVGK